MRLNFSLAAVLAAALIAPSTARAQSPCPSPCTINAGEAFSVAFDHDGKDTLGYRLYINDVQVGSDIPLSSLSNGTVTVPGVIAGARGAYSLRVSAFNQDGEKSSLPVTFTTVSLPSSPTNVRILISVSVADGKVTIKIIPKEDQ